MDKLAPIVMFVYNRPDHTKKTVEGILKNPEAKDSTLYIFADGPKPNITPEGLDNLERVREYIHTISGFKEVIIDESEKNRGLAPATIRGLSIVFEKNDRLIMIEDDDYPSEYFLSYENECLEKFKDDERVWCVGGFTDTRYLKPDNGDDVFFVNRPTSWGFGFWKRCWEKIIWDKDDLKGLFRHKDIIRGFDKYGGKDHSIIMMSFLKGKSSSWSIRYHFASYLNNGYTVLPNKSLIMNIGQDGTGTHSTDIGSYSLEMSDSKMVIPNEVKFSKKKNKQIIFAAAPNRFPFSLADKLGIYYLVRRITHPSMYKI